MRTLISIFAVAAALAGCALPNTNVRSGSVRPTIAVSNAPVGSVLVIDGIVAGVATEFDGVSKRINVEEGLHRVEIRLNDRVIHEEKIVISSGESRVISVGGTR